MQNEERAPAELLRSGPTEPEGNSRSRALQGHPALCYQNFPESQEITATTSFFVTQSKMSLDTSAHSRATRLPDQGLSWITPPFIYVQTTSQGSHRKHSCRPAHLPGWVHAAFRAISEYSGVEEEMLCYYTHLPVQY